MNEEEGLELRRKQQRKGTAKLSSTKLLDIADSRSSCSAATGNTNMVFFGGSENDRRSYTNSYSWKSPSTRLADEFGRIQRLVRHVAPEQFRSPARPSNGPCNVVPTTVLEYVEHAKDILEMKTQQLERNLAARREAARVQHMTGKGEAQLPIKSRFGRGAKVYTDGLSPVLCKPTIWSIEHGELGGEYSEWPAQSELQECGDKRENDQIPTRCGRYLPAPTVRILLPRQIGVEFDGNQPRAFYTIKKASSLDEHGPIFSVGPSPIEISIFNSVVDEDPAFEDRGHILLGNNLMKEIGEWKSPFTPDWLIERRQREEQAQAARRTFERAVGVVSFVPHWH